MPIEILAFFRLPQLIFVYGALLTIRFNRSDTGHLRRWNFKNVRIPDNDWVRES
jgi:hypothetical protein